MGKIIWYPNHTGGEGKLTSVNQVKAVAGQGLEGDRYFYKTGTYSKKHGPPARRPSSKPRRLKRSGTTTTWN